MKRPTVVTAALLSLSVCAALGVAAAAPPSSRVPRPEARRESGDPMLQQMARELNLTETQKSRIGAILADQRKQMRALHQASQAKIRRVLTQAQQKKLNEMQSRQPQQMRELPVRTREF